MGDTHKREGIDSPRRVMGLNNKDIETSVSNLGRQSMEKTQRNRDSATVVLNSFANLPKRIRDLPTLAILPK